MLSLFFKNFLFNKFFILSLLIISNTGLSDNKKKLIAEIKEAKEGKNKNPIKTHQRDLIVLPYMIGLTINVFDGKEFKPVGIGAEMVGHYIGEYAISNKRVNHGAPGVGASRSSLYVPLK